MKEHSTELEAIIWVGEADTGGMAALVFATDSCYLTANVRSSISEEYIKERAAEGIVFVGDVFGNKGNHNSPIRFDRYDADTDSYIIARYLVWDWRAGKYHEPTENPYKDVIGLQPASSKAT